MPASETRPIVHDPDFPAASLLLGDAGREVVTGAVAEEGGELQELLPAPAPEEPALASAAP